MNMSLIEMHLLYKLSLLMEQKHSHNYGSESSSSSKKRGLHQMDENDQNYISRFEGIQSQIVDGAKVELMLIGAGTELELILDEAKP